MAHSIVMPALEMAQETGKLISWRKKEGDTVVKGEPLLDVETDKAVVEVEAQADGILAGLKAREGDVIPVGQTIGWIVAPGEKPPLEETASASGRRMDTRPVPSAAANVSAPVAAAPATNTRISPKARRLAREHGVDLARVRGSGSEGEILAEDVMAIVASAGPRAGAAVAPERTEPPQAEAYATQTLSQVARLMAERTTQSWTTVPHFFVARDVDAGALLAAREKLGSGIEKERGVRLSHTDLLIAAVARTLAKHPRLNATWTGSEIRIIPEINIGIAMAVEDGVVAAVIHDANTKDLSEIAGLRRDLTARARAGKLRPADISGGTFTISNLGMYKVDAFTAIIVSPQAAILAVGQISDRVVPVDGKPGIRPMMTVTLSCDHRVADGARAAQFLNDLAAAIVEPEKLIR
ncbi:MAG TPA: dihydrolipoamide acetyltransferase family protein [Candidatus Acidoferrales bacterium]|nr:dihydrolipoamide acetyltransferase family protein [Candidatus Acidoferrales bacterium]